MFHDLEQELDSGLKKLEKSLPLDLGLDSKQLKARVPFFANLFEPQMKTIARMLHPRLALPGETIIRKGDRGDAMYFIASGCV